MLLGMQGTRSSQRVVFDDEGNKQEPLAMLTIGELAPQEQSVQDPGQQAGLYVANDTPAERFKAAADVMRRCVVCLRACCRGCSCT